MTPNDDDADALNQKAPAQNSAPEDRDTPEMLRYRAGAGGWDAFVRSGMSLERVFEAAAEWKQQLAGVERPWLCWNVDNEWCRVQQQQVLEVGWTPVVGFDPRVGPPPVEKGAVLIDFNKTFQLPTMWLHFPLEFTFLFADRLAFWHADLILRREKMRLIAHTFADLPDGSMAAVWVKPGWRALLQPRKQRYWEVIGCNTRGSSEDQFRKGCGWWNCFHDHPNTPPAEQARRNQYYWDSGSGIYYWATKLGGKVTKIPSEDIEEGHCTSIKRSDYKRMSPTNATRNLSLELSLNNDLNRVCVELGLADLLRN